MGAAEWTGYSGSYVSPSEANNYPDYHLGGGGGGNSVHHLSTGE